MVHCNYFNCAYPDFLTDLLTYWWWISSLPVVFSPFMPDISVCFVRFYIPVILCTLAAINFLLSVYYFSDLWNESTILTTAKVWFSVNWLLSILSLQVFSCCNFLKCYQSNLSLHLLHFLCDIMYVDQVYLQVCKVMSLLGNLYFFYRAMLAQSAVMRQ